jgi:hypothetical protein
MTGPGKISTGKILAGLTAEKRQRVFHTRSRMHFEQVHCKRKVAAGCCWLLLHCWGYTVWDPVSIYYGLLHCWGIYRVGPNMGYVFFFVFGPCGIQHTRRKKKTPRTP